MPPKPSRKDSRKAEKAEQGEQDDRPKHRLRTVFEEYCAGNKDMDGKSFAKLVKDSKLLDSKLTSTDVDITFEKIKERAERRIAYDQFQNGLALLAKKKGLGLHALTREVEKLNGPVLTGTKAEPNRFHDDKSLYTGVYANGGPSTVDEGKDLAAVLNRSPADIRGVKKSAYNGEEIRREKNKAMKQSSLKSLPVTVALPDTIPLRGLFKDRCEGHLTMDSAQFTQLAREKELLDNSMTATDVNLIFVQIKDREEQRITYGQFLEGLAMIAETKGIERAQVEFALTGTNAEPMGGVANGLPPPCSDTRQLKEVFKEYCGKQKTMDGRDFAKLAKDCKLLDRNLSATEVDILFMKSKLPNEKRISYEQFLQGLAFLAQKKQIPNPDIELMVSKSQGPILVGTRAEPNKFYDDKSLYTGVYKHGGPKTVDVTDEANKDLSTFVDRGVDRTMDLRASVQGSLEVHRTASAGEGEREPEPERTRPAREREHVHQQSGRAERAERAEKGGKTERGEKTEKAEKAEKGERGERGERGVQGGKAEKASGAPRLSSPRRRRKGGDDGGGAATLAVASNDSDGLQRAFRVWSGEAGSGGRMDGWEFAKLAKDCRLLDKNLTTTDVDLIFLKVKEREEKKISYEQFLVALPLLAERKDVPQAELEEQVASCAADGKILTGTQAEYTKWYDDKKTFTGTHKLDPGERPPPDALDMWGKEDSGPPKQVQLNDKLMKEGPGSNGRNGGILRNAGMRMLGLEELNLPRGTAVDSRELQRVFNDYAQGQHTMERMLFTSLVRESKLLDQRLTSSKVDEVYARFAKNNSSGRITYGQFLEALAEVAKEKGIHVEAVVARVEWASAPAKVLMEENTEQNKVLEVTSPKQAKKKKTVQLGGAVNIS